MCPGVGLPIGYSVVFSLLKYSFYSRVNIGQLQIESFQAGGNRQGLNFSQIGAIILSLPPTLAEQEAIAEALSDAEALIEALEQLIAKKRQIKQGAMQELLTGKRRLPGYNGEWTKKSFGELFDISGGLSASRSQLSTEGYCYLHYGDIHLSNKYFINVKMEYSNSIRSVGINDEPSKRLN